MKIEWRKVGRQYVADVGPLSMHIKIGGNDKVGHRYMVQRVLGVPVFGEWHNEFKDASISARKKANQLLKELSAAGLLR